jgi:hypothetical protein
MQDGVSGCQTLLRVDQKEEGYLGNLTVSSNGSRALVTWPAVKQYSGDRASFGDEATRA